MLHCTILSGMVRSGDSVVMVRCSIRAVMVCCIRWHGFPPRPRPHRRRRASTW
jgi:hypothetical protein